MEHERNQIKRECAYCGKELFGRKKKYCNELCRYRYLSIKNHTDKKLQLAQHLRIARAEKSQRLGKIGVRFN